MAQLIEAPRVDIEAITVEDGYWVFPPILKSLFCGAKPKFVPTVATTYAGRHTVPTMKFKDWTRPLYEKVDELFAEWEGRTYRFQGVFAIDITGGVATCSVDCFEPVTLIQS
jgi:hypothetical protein